MKIEINTQIIQELLDTIDFANIQKIVNIDNQTLSKLKSSHSDSELLNTLYSLDLKTVKELHSAGITWKNNLQQTRKNIAKYILNDIKTSNEKVYYFFIRKEKLLANKDTENVWFAFKDDFGTGDFYYGAYNDLDEYHHIDSREYTDEEIIENIAEMLKYSSRYEKTSDMPGFINQFKINNTTVNTCTK